MGEGHFGSAQAPVVPVTAVQVLEGLGVLMGARKRLVLPKGKSLAEGKAARERDCRIYIIW